MPPFPPPPFYLLFSFLSLHLLTSLLLSYLALYPSSTSILVLFVLFLSVLLLIFYLFLPFLPSCASFSSFSPTCPPSPPPLHPSLRQSRTVKAALAATPLHYKSCDIEMSGTILSFSFCFLELNEITEHPRGQKLCFLPKLFIPFNSSNEHIVVWKRAINNRVSTSTVNALLGGKNVTTKLKENRQMNKLHPVRKTMRRD